MAYLHARSNVCRSGVTYAGLANHPLTLTAGGTTRKSETLSDTKYTITIRLDGSPSTCALRFKGAKPSVGQDLLLALGGEAWWGGTITSVKAEIRQQLVFWDVQAIDWTWLLNRFAIVNETYDNLSINTIARQLIASYSNGGFTGGYLPSSLGTVTQVTFADARLMECLQRLAKMANAGAGAFIRIRPDKAIDIGTTFPDGLALTLGNSTDVRDLQWAETLDQVRTRTSARGRSSSTTAAAGPTATTVAVDDCTWFSGGSSAYASGDEFSYTGVSVSSGPGSLTGVSGLARDLPQGTQVQVSVRIDDAAAQTALATVLGGGRSGIVAHVLHNEAWTLAEATARATADVTFNKSSAQSVSYTMIAASAKVRTQIPGTVMTASVTTPLTISGSFRIQSVSIQPFDPQSSTTDPWMRATVSAMTTSRADLFDILGVDS